jgi:hypothetical protein
VQTEFLRELSGFSQRALRSEVLALADIKDLPRSAPRKAAEFVKKFKRNNEQFASGDGSGLF